MDLGLAGKKAFVTGSTGGIGAAVVEGFADEGVSVALFCRDTVLGGELAAKLRASRPGIQVAVVELDLGRPESIDLAVSRAVQALGGVDILVNCAGGAQRGLLEELPDEAWLHYLNIKPLGYVRVCRAVLPYLRRSGHGRIINIAGAHGKEPTAWSVMGGLVNAAVLSFSKALADELAPHGITVNAVSPGHTATRRWDELVARTAQERHLSLEEARDALLARVPMRRVVSPREVADVVLFLASERADAITGCSINVDGGRSRSI